VPTKRNPAKSKSTTRAASGPEAKKIFDTYVARKNPALSDLATALRHLVKKTLPNSTESINPWGIPTFNLLGPIAYIMIGKNHITLGFTQGSSLKNSAGLLEGTGKNLRHIKISEAAQLNDPNLAQLLKEAAKADRANPLTTSMRKK
jgi:hypothetical protein